MTLNNDARTIREALDRYRHFQECLLEAVYWRDGGRIVELDFSYIWDDTGAILRNPRRVLVRLTDAVVVAMESPLTAEMLAHPERLTWAIKEIAELRLARESELLPPPEGVRDVLQLVAVWEGRGRVDILFRDLMIEDSAVL
jgi:hypothetical protein